MSVKGKAVVDYTSNETSVRKKIHADKVLVAVGRKPYTEGLNLKKSVYKM